MNTIIEENEEITTTNIINKIYCFKLVTNEIIVANFLNYDDEEGNLLIQNPLIINTIYPNDGDISTLTVFESWLVHPKQDIFCLNSNMILVLYEPNDAVEKAYKEMVKTIEKKDKENNKMVSISSLDVDDEGTITIKKERKTMQ
jgi:hypothetical protein